MTFISPIRILIENIELAENKLLVTSQNGVAVLKQRNNFQTLELIRPVDGISSSKIQKEFVVYNVLVTSQQLSAGLLKYPNLPTEVRQWAESCL